LRESRSAARAGDGQLREVVTVVEDPVCHMATDREEAADRVGLAGVACFCLSRGCRAEPEADRMRILQASS
jgi:hypothetical protein